SEITQLLNASLEKRAKLKTGGFDELEKDMEEFDNNLALNSGIGKMKKGAKKKLTTGELRLPEEIKRKLGEANALYIARDYGNAISILQQVITDHPQAHPAWNTLGLVHDELGNKSKSLRLRMVAAHMCHDPNLWKELAQKSIENNAPKQAIHCLTKALSIEPTDVDALWDRSFLFKQAEKNSEAIEGFSQILKIMPHHFKVINELAQLFRSEGKTVEAIKMYEEAIVYHAENPDQNEDDEDEDDEEEFSDKLGYSEINMLSELYLILNDYGRCLDTIKTGLRLVQQRQDETWWIDHVNDDDEYFEEDETRSEFPIELRVRMGVCRVYLDHVDIAMRHFNYLLQYPPTTYPDLHQDIAYAYYDKRHYELALKVFQKIVDAADEIEVEILIRTADCYRETGHLDTSVIFYVNVLEEQPENLDVMVSLATVYEEQGKEEQALDLVEYVMKKNREKRKLNKGVISNNENINEENEESEKLKVGSIFNETPKTKKDEKNLLMAQKAKEKHEKELNVKALFDKLKRIDNDHKSGVVNMDRTIMRDYMRAAQELWNVFYSTRAFYPNNRCKRYDGFYSARKEKKEKLVSDFEAQFLANRLRLRMNREDEGETENEELDEEEKQELESTLNELKLSHASQYLDFPFEKWCEVFMKYAYMLVMTKRSQEAYDLLQNAFEANVFYHSDSFKLSLKLTLLGCALMAPSPLIVQDACRWICNYFQYKSDTFRLYTAMVSSDKESPNGYIHSSQMKYVSRIIRLMDALVSNSKEGLEDNRIAMDEIRELDDAIQAMNVNPSTMKEQGYMRFYETPNQSDKLTKDGGEHKPFSNTNPVLLTLFGHMLTTSRNYLSSTLYYMRSYSLAPKDPVNTLSLAMSFIQASSQRRCDNRHMMIMQGMLFMLEYTKLMGHCQEAEYNMAYCFHNIGLTHLAIPHYEKVLCMPSKAKMHIEAEKPIEEVYTWPVDDMEEDDEDIEYDPTDLTREAAYNLHLIYVTSGSLSLAEIVLMKYCTI
ncbi:transcription factor TFIIIC subunit tfc4, partial [Rhizopus stolonifer]